MKHESLPTGQSGGAFKKLRATLSIQQPAGDWGASRDIDGKTDVGPIKKYVLDRLLHQWSESLKNALVVDAFRHETA